MTNSPSTPRPETNTIPARQLAATLTGLALTTAASLSGMSLGWIALFLASYIATALP